MKIKIKDKLWKIEIDLRFRDKPLPIDLINFNLMIDGLNSYQNINFYFIIQWIQQIKNRPY